MEYKNGKTFEETISHYGCTIKNEIDFNGGDTRSCRTMIDKVIRYIPNILVGAAYNIQALENWSEKAISDYNEYISNGGAKSRYYSSKRIRVEHSLPVNLMITMMIEDNTLEGIIGILRNYVMPTVITMSEDDMINKAGYKISMPEGNDSVFARYDAVGINMMKFV